MINTIFYKRSSGVTLIELVVVLSIISILAVIGVPQYGRYVAKSRIRNVSNDLFQNMRLARTMAIKENRTYLITFTPPDTYIIGFDGNNNNSLLDAGDGYGSTGVRVVNVQNEYGSTVLLGTPSFITVPPNGPNGMGIADAALFDFNPDGSVGTTGTVYIQDSNRGYTYCTELANNAGETNSYVWQGNAEDPANVMWIELR